MWFPVLICTAAMVCNVGKPVVGKKALPTEASCMRAAHNAYMLLELSEDFKRQFIRYRCEHRDG